MTTGTTPEIAFSGVVKEHGGSTPLRVARLELRRDDRIALFGLDEAGAETMLHLISGAALPDEGTVRVGDRDTRDIATDTDWLLSLDRFGVVTRRAVLLETLSAAANIALPMTAAIDPLSTETMDQVAKLADEAGLPADRLNVPCGTLRPAHRLRVHLARAVALDPALLLLEHPTGDLRDPAASAAFGEQVRAMAARRRIGWFACTSDVVFAKATGADRRRLDAHTGAITRIRWWRR